MSALPVQIRSLSKYFGAVRAVDDVSFDIKAGEFLTLLGPSGSGKTTLLMMIAGFSRPNQGSIRIADQEIVHLPPHKRNIGMVFQNYALFPHMTVGENIAYPLKLRKRSQAEIAERVKHVLSLVQLEQYAERRINQLSGGQRQRIALARAIVFEPRILLMDEPLSALDKQLRETMQIEIRKLHNRLGMTTISVTHDQREALTMSDRIAVFSQGRLSQIAAPSDLYERPVNKFIAEFIGESSFLPLERNGTDLVHAGRSIKAASRPENLNGPLLLMVRPERLKFLRQDAVVDDEQNVFKGDVSAIVFQGDSLLFDVKLETGQNVYARMPNRAEGVREFPKAGERVIMALDRDDARIVRAE